MKRFQLKYNARFIAGSDQKWEWKHMFLAFTAVLSFLSFLHDSSSGIVDNLNKRASKMPLQARQPVFVVGE